MEAGRRVDVSWIRTTKHKGSRSLFGIIPYKQEHISPSITIFPRLTPVSKTHHY